MSDLPLPEPLPEDTLPEDEALDIQHDPDPASPVRDWRRLPNLGHALMFFSLAMLALALVPGIVFGLSHIPLQRAEDYPTISLVSEGLSWVAAMTAALFLFPRLWQRPFIWGVHWNTLAVRRFWYWIVPAGVAANLLIEWAERHVRQPDSDTFAKLTSTPHGIWTLTAVAVLISPLMEEMAFRGFLMPALATMYDWLSLERTPAALRRWASTTGHTLPATMFGAVFANVPFALIHTGQLHNAWGAVGLIYLAGLVFSFVRARTHSLAASTLTHAVYNLTSFVWLFVVSGGYRHLDKL